MGSIRKLKKQIDTRVYEILSDCFTFSEIHPGAGSGDLDEIISDVVNFRNDLIHRVNNPDPDGDQRGIKTHYQLISRDLNAGVDKLCERLSSVTMKKKK